MISVASSTVPTAIASVQASYAALPLPDTTKGLTGPVIHFCDCGTGASGSCVAGNDTTGNGSAANPYQSLAKAVTTLNAASSGTTIAMCQGGAFNATASYTINTTCTAGTTCFDLREYSPTTFSATAKPIINNSLSSILFTVQNGHGGVRFMNLSFKGNNTGSNELFFLWNAAHDVTIANNTIDSFSLPIDNENQTSATSNTNVTVTGNNITNSSVMGFLGGGNNQVLSYNYFEGNGTNDGSAYRNHSIYISSHNSVTGNYVIGNYVHGQYGSTCYGSQIVVHSIDSDLQIKGNYVAADASAANIHCWGIEVDNGAYAAGDTGAVISNNTILVGGNEGIVMNNCNTCEISNNLLVNNTSANYGGISVASQAHGSFNLNTNTTVKNNTIYFSPATSGSLQGITIGVEGSGYIVANNVISSAQSSGSLTCSNYTGGGLTPAAYTAINNQLCYKSSGTPTWEGGTGNSIVSWTGSTGFDTASIISSDPLFTAPTATPPNFVPNTGSPLIGAGTHTYTTTTDIVGTTRTNPPAIGAYE